MLYSRIYKIQQIAYILYAADPMNLVECGVPIDEYESEAISIYVSMDNLISMSWNRVMDNDTNGLLKLPLTDCITKVCANVFSKAFDRKFDDGMEVWGDIAYRIGRLYTEADKNLVLPDVVVGNMSQVISHRR